MKLNNKSDVITYFTTPYIYIQKSALSSVCAETLPVLQLAVSMISHKIILKHALCNKSSEEFRIFANFLQFLHMMLRCILS